MKAFKKVALAALVAAGFSTGAHASLIGSTVTLSGPGVSATPAVVNTGVEFSYAPYASIDFGADTLTLTGPGFPYNTTIPGTYTFKFTNFSDQITGLTFFSNTGFNFPKDAFGFTADSISITPGAFSFASNSKLVLDITTAQVPEPASVALLGLGLFGFVASRRKSAKRNA